MKWSIQFTKQAYNFLIHNDISGEFAVDVIRVALRKFNGEVVSVDIKKMKGEWKGFYRIRKGKLRMIVYFNFDRQIAFVEVVDWRGNIY